MEKMRKALAPIYKFLVMIGTIATGIMAVGITIAVVLRYFFSISSAGGEEIITTLFAFTTFWGIGIAILNGEHIKVSIVHDIIPKKIRKVCDIIIQLLVLFLVTFIFIYAMKWILNVSGQPSTGLRIEMTYLYSMIPIGFGIAILCAIYKLIEVIVTPIDESYNQKSEIDMAIEEAKKEIEECEKKQEMDRSTDK